MHSDSSTSLRCNVHRVGGSCQLSMPPALTCPWSALLALRHQLPCSSSSALKATSRGKLACSEPSSPDARDEQHERQRDHQGLWVVKGVGQDEHERGQAEQDEELRDGWGRQGGKVRGRHELQVMCWRECAGGAPGWSGTPNR